MSPLSGSPPPPDEPGQTRAGPRDPLVEFQYRCMICPGPLSRQLLLVINSFFLKYIPHNTNPSIAIGPRTLLPPSTNVHNALFVKVEPQSFSNQPKILSYFLGCQITASVFYKPGGRKKKSDCCVSQLQTSENERQRIFAKFQNRGAHIGAPCSRIFRSKMMPPLLTSPTMGPAVERI